MRRISAGSLSRVSINIDVSYWYSSEIMISHIADVAKPSKLPRKGSVDRTRCYLPRDPSRSLKGILFIPNGNTLEKNWFI